MKSNRAKKIIGVCLIGMFAAAAVISGSLFWKEYRDAAKSEDTFSELADMISEVERPGGDETSESGDMSQQSKAEASPELTEEEKKALEAKLAREKYGALYQQNPDFVGWIFIDGTGINYPVMQSPDNPDYYLKHSFEKTWSDYGVPYLDEACVIGQSNNLVIYGHHMRNGSMFCDLDHYTDPDFCKEYPIICFDTLSSFGEYEVIAVFRYNTNWEEFRYDRCVAMDDKAFVSFIEQIHARELYSTGKSAEYGDELLTLSTCEYTYKNGRLVVVARKVMQ